MEEPNAWQAISAPYWKGRAEKAEAELTRLREALGKIAETGGYALPSYDVDYEGGRFEAHLRVNAHRDIARNALSPKEPEVMEEPNAWQAISAPYWKGRAEKAEAELTRLRADRDSWKKHAKAVEGNLRIIGEHDVKPLRAELTRLREALEDAPPPGSFGFGVSYYDWWFGARRNALSPKELEKQFPSPEDSDYRGEEPK